MVTIGYFSFLKEVINSFFFFRLNVLFIVCVVFQLIEEVKEQIKLLH